MEPANLNPGIEEIMLRIVDVRKKLSTEEYELLMMQLKALTDVTATWVLYHMRSPNQS